MKRLVVDSEDKAWAVLEAATTNRSIDEFLEKAAEQAAEVDDDDAIFEIVFRGWPNLELDFKGKDWHSSVPTRVMLPLLDVQKEIFRAFTDIQYGEPNLRRLTDEDRDRLEVVVDVKEGSSIFNAGLAKQLTAMAEAAVQRMNGTEAVISVLGVALLIAATVAYKAWLSSRVEVKKLDKEVNLSTQETQRMKIMADAMNARPALVSVSDESAATQNRLLKSLKPGDSLKMSGVLVSSAEAEVLVQPERDRSQDLYLEGLYKIIGNRTDKGDGFVLRVESHVEGTIFNAETSVNLDADSLEALRAAEWDKKLVYLRITASTLRGSISNAAIGFARPLDPDLDL